MNPLTSKAISEQTGVSIPTLSYYEQIGLLDRVERATNRHRRYTANDLRRIDFLKRLRATGMSISQMQYYVDLYREGDTTSAERLRILETHRLAVQAQMDALSETLAFLDVKIVRYRQEQSLILTCEQIPMEIGEQHA